MKLPVAFWFAATGAVALAPMIEYLMSAVAVWSTPAGVNETARRKAVSQPGYRPATKPAAPIDGGGASK